MQAQLQIGDGGVPPYAAATDFGEIFTEQCFISGLEECLEGIGVFMEWARLWARRAIIRQAIRMMKSAPENADHWLLVSGWGAPDRKQARGLLS
jgi:hypothetical protein